MTAMLTKIQPLGKRVLIKRSESAKTKGGLFLPESAQEKPRHGEIIARGEGSFDAKGNHVPLTVAIGQTVLYASYSGTKIETEDKSAEYLILSEDDILGIIEG